jgi:hypothetical protein
LCRPAKLGGGSTNGLDTFLRAGVNLGGSKVEQSLASYAGRLATDHPEGSFAADHRKIHLIDGALFVDDIVPLYLHACFFECAPEEVLLVRAKEQVVDLPGIVQPSSVGQDKSDPPQVAAGDGVGELDQLAELQFIVTLFGVRMVRLVR